MAVRLTMKKPPAAADIRRGLATHRREFGALQTRHAELEQAKAEALDDSGEYRRIGRELADVASEIERLTTIICLLEEQLPAAEELERLEALRAEAEELRREADAHSRRLVRDFEKYAAPLAKLVADTDDVNRRIAALNAKLIAAGQPQIPGPEAFRASAPRHYPEASHTIRRWVAPDGTACTFLKPDPDRPGESIPANPGSWREIEVKVVSSPARDEPARMPPRLADTVVLPSLKADSPALWPPMGRAL